MAVFGLISDYPLTGSVLAYSNNGSPLLLTTTDSLPSSTQSVIQSSQPTNAIIIGGTGSVSTRPSDRVPTIDRKVASDVNDSPNSNDLL